ncbi:MAG: ATP-binding cassette domain-containing protein [Candidatus Limnocylindrales bacterium]
MEATTTDPGITGSSGRTVVELTDVSMAFGSVRVLQGVSVTVREGSVLALIGANGAGKSTLIKILSGVYPDHGGEIRVDGKLISVDSPRVARGLGSIPSTRRSRMGSFRACLSQRTSSSTS